MPVPVSKEPGEWARYECERCCFCRTPTPFWTEIKTRSQGDQVACCEACAKRATPEDVPSKRVWMRRETIATGGTMGHPMRAKPYPDEIAIYPPKMAR